MDYKTNVSSSLSNPRLLSDMGDCQTLDSLHQSLYFITSRFKSNSYRMVVASKPVTIPSENLSFPLGGEQKPELAIPAWVAPKETKAVCELSPPQSTNDQSD